MNRNNFSFVPLDSSTFSNQEIMETYENLRGAFENTYPNEVDASDAYVLTVFPFKREDEIPDEYEVENYITGFYKGMPALQKCSDKNVILLLNDRLVPHLEII